ncbi:MAG: transglutaminase domain-containing protein [Bacteroidales bacterium]|nr:transglutaminase domain-containing protein [Bacteroidales bacterium]
MQAKIVHHLKAGEIMRDHCFNLFNIKSIKIISFFLFLFTILWSNSALAEWKKGRFWYFIENIEVEDPKKTEILLWVAMPMNHIGQEAIIETIHPAPVEIIEDPLAGNRVVFWRITEIKDVTELHFYADFKVNPSEVNTDVDPQKVQPYDLKSKEYVYFTRSEPGMNITREIKEKAFDIVKQESNPYLQAKRIFDWVIANMTYQQTADESQSLKTNYEKLKGDCGSFSRVFVALCRALGIPARSVTCRWFTESGHVWAEILIPPYGWIPVDTSAAYFMVPGANRLDEESLAFTKNIGIPRIDPQYLFGNLYPNRLIVSIGNYFVMESKKTGIKEIFRSLQPGGSKAIPPAIKLKGISRKVVHGGFYMFGEDRDDVSLAKKKAYRELSTEYFSAGLMDKAEIALLERIEEDPDDPANFFYLGQVYMEKKITKKAIKAFEKGLAVSGEDSKVVINIWIRNLLGNCYDLQGQRKKALLEYKTVIESGIDVQGSIEHAKKYIEKPYSEQDE